MSGDVKDKNKAEPVRDRRPYGRSQEPQPWNVSLFEALK